MQLKSQRRCWAKRETCISSASTQSPQVGTVSAVRAISASGRQTKSKRTDLEGADQQKSQRELFQKSAWAVAIMLVCCDEQQSSLLQTWKAEFFMMDDIKGLCAGRLSRRIAERHRWGWFAIVRHSRLNRPFHPGSFSLQCAGCLVFLPGPTLRLLSRRTSALGHISCTQQSSMWFWNSHVYPSNSYQYSVTCVWISGPYLTQGNCCLWKRIPNVTAYKHVLLLQQAWGLQEPPESTDINESLSLGRYNSIHACLCCCCADITGYQCLGYQLKSTIHLSS